MKRIAFLSLTALLFAACVSNHFDSYDGENNQGNDDSANDFNFSTTSDVNLTVDYSASNPVGPVFFRVFSENPFIDDELNPNIKPVYSNYTDGEGRFSQSVELPSYATDLYIFTGDFFVDEQLMNVKVTNNTAFAKAGETRGVNRAAARRVSPGSGT